MNKKILSLTSTAAFLAPLVAFAQDIGSMARAAAMNVVYVGDAVVIIGWVVTGILFLIAYGEGGKITTARTALFACIAGTILMLIVHSVAGPGGFVGKSFGI